eukprot:2447641-Rhodomonas_salina.1
MGITGLDVSSPLCALRCGANYVQYVAQVIAETEPDNEDLVVEMELGFGKCVLAVQGPVTDGFDSAKHLAGQRIVTSFPVPPQPCPKHFAAASAA